MLKPDKVSVVACGRHHTVVAMESGAVMAVGSNTEGQLGVGRHPESTSVPMPVTGRIIEQYKWHCFLFFYFRNVSILYMYIMYCELGETLIKINREKGK